MQLVIVSQNWSKSVQGRWVVRLSDGVKVGAVAARRHTGKRRMKDAIRHRWRVLKLTKEADTSHVPCKFFRQGACQAGKACPFSHDLASVTDNVCKYFAKVCTPLYPLCIYPARTSYDQASEVHELMASSRGTANSAPNAQTSTSFPTANASPTTKAPQ